MKWNRFQQSVVVRFQAKMVLLSTLLLLFTLTVELDGLKVLTIAPFGARSHFIIGHAIAKSLLDVGHEITMLSPYPLKSVVQNYTDISIAKTMEKLQKEKGVNMLDFRNIPLVVYIPSLYQMTAELVDSVMVDDEVVKLMNSKEKYDVCIIQSFNVDALLGIVDHFDCVAISFTTFGVVKWIDDMTSNQSPSSYVTHPFLRYNDKMTFSERLVNTLLNVFEGVLYEFYYKPMQRHLYNKHFPNAHQTFDEIYRNSAIYFINTHVSLASARPYLPNMIEICGIHIEPVKSLPSDIQLFLDSADEGVILFSMGSNIRAIDWPLEKREVFVNVFGQLKQKVLWKYENDTLPGKSDNVMISKWLPQRDVVGHKNVKLFITHGGLLGTTEALIEGVPLLGIPIFGDQKMNIAKAVTRGYALQISFDEINGDSLYAAIIELLSNGSYRDSAQEISKRFMDRPMTPQQTVVYWVEYAVRHKGAPHLRAAGNSLNFIEFHSIDTYSVLFLATILCLYMVYSVLNFLFGKCCKISMKLKQN